MTIKTFFIRVENPLTKDRLYVQVEPDGEDYEVRGAFLDQKAKTGVVNRHYFTKDNWAEQIKHWGFEETEVNFEIEEKLLNRKTEGIL